MPSHNCTEFEHWLEQAIEHAFDRGCLTVNTESLRASDLPAGVLECSHCRERWCRESVLSAAFTAWDTPIPAVDFTQHIVTAWAAEHRTSIATVNSEGPRQRDVAVIPDGPKTAATPSLTSVSSNPSSSSSSAAHGWLVALAACLLFAVVWPLTRSSDPTQRPSGKSDRTMVNKKNTAGDSLADNGVNGSPGMAAPRSADLTPGQAQPVAVADEPAWSELFADARSACFGLVRETTDAIADSGPVVLPLSANAAGETVTPPENMLDPAIPADKDAGWLNRMQSDWAPVGRGVKRSWLFLRESVPTGAAML